MPSQLTEQEEFDRICGPWQPPDPAGVAMMLRGFDRRWWVGGGWAVELRSGAPRRHHDLDLVVLRRDFEALRDHLGPMDWQMQRGGVLTPLPTGAKLPEDRHHVWVRALPSPGRQRVQRSGERGIAAGMSGTGRQGAQRPWLLDVLLTPADADTWICRRNAEIRLPLAEVGLRTADGIPYLKPEIVLLFKAAHLEGRDVADFETLLPGLDEAARAWLVDALRATHPGHEWIARL